MMQATKPSGFRRLALWCGLLLGIAVLLPLGASGQTVGATRAGALIAKGDGRLSTRLAQLAQPTFAAQSAEAQANALGVAADGPGSLIRSQAGELLTYIRVADTGDATLAALRSRGARITNVAASYGIVTAYVAPGSLNGLAALGTVQNIKEEYTPYTAGAGVEAPTNGPLASVPGQAGCASAITSEGDAQLGADDARADFGVNGAGVIVGVLSDSYNRAAAATTAEQDIASGDLPGAGNPCGRTNGVNVIAESQGTDNIDEGRAMLQIVHDLAPESPLAFATANGGIFTFSDNIRRLRSQAGASVIVDDISYFVEPFYQDGPVTLAINDVNRQGATYFTSAGNSTDTDGAGNVISSYEAPTYRPTACPALQGSSGPTTNYANDCHNFNPAGNNNSSSFVLAPNGGIQMVFQWAEPWFGVNTDLDVYLVNTAGQVLAAGGDSNSGTSGTQVPFEFLSYGNTTGANQEVRLVIARYEGAPAPRLKYIFLRSGGILATQFNATNSTDTFGPTIFGHSGAAGAISTAAVSYDNANAPEPFTSRGPQTLLFGPTASNQPAGPLGAPETRIKPDVAATDGGANTFFGEFYDGAYRFNGTSAAAPHGAAVAALMKQRAIANGRILIQGNLEQLLEATATDVASGTPASVGAGLINARSTVAAVTDLPPPTSIYLPLTTR